MGVQNPDTSPRTVFYFVRHGETDYNRDRIVQGRRINSVLNATGRAQAAAVAKRLAPLDLDAIYTSTLDRAVETASAIAGRHADVPVHRLADLEEMSWGIYEGEPPSAHIQEAFEEMYSRWGAGDYAYRVDEGESILDVQARALRAMDVILSRHAKQKRAQTVVVVAHGRLLRVLLASLLTTFGLERMHELRHANTCVNRLVYRDGAYEADLLNCTAHLEHAETIMVE